MLYCVDTHMVIWGIKRECTNGQENMIDRATHFINECELNQHKILIPTIVVAEILGNVPLHDHARLTEKISNLFMVIPFDIAAARAYAKMMAEQKVAIEDAKANDYTSRHIKADFMIAATAIARQCHRLYTEDKALLSFATPYIEVHKISDIDVPPSQPQLI